MSLPQHLADRVARAEALAKNTTPDTEAAIVAEINATTDAVKAFTEGDLDALLKASPVIRGDRAVGDALAKRAAGIDINPPPRTAEPTQLDKLAAGGDLRKLMSSMQGKLGELSAQLQKIEAQPMPGGPAQLDPRRLQ